MPSPAATKMLIDNAIDRRVDSAASTATGTTEAVHSVYTIPANTLTKNSIIRVRATGTIVLGGTDAFDIRLRNGLAGDELFHVNVAGVEQETAGSLVLDVQMVVRVAGAAGDIVSGGTLFVGVAAPGTAPGGIFGDHVVDTAVDLTAALALSLTVDFGGTTDSIRFDQFTVDVLRPSVAGDAS